VPSLPSEDCVFRLDVQDGYKQPFDVTFVDVGLTDDGFTGGSITGFLRETPVYVEIAYDDTHVIEAYSSGIVSYSGTTLTIDCSSNVIELVSIYSRELTSTEVNDRYKERTFRLE